MTCIAQSVNTQSLTAHDTLTTVDSRYLEIEGTLKNTSRYPYFEISDLYYWGKNYLNNQILQMTM